MSSATCESIEPLLVTYALDALDETERSSVEAHMKTCAFCRAKHAAFLELMADIALSSPQHMPPPSLEYHLAKQVGAGQGDPPNRLVGWLRGRLGPSRRWATVAGAVLCMAVIAMGGLIVEVARLSTQQLGLTTRLAQQQQAIMQYAQECTNQTSLAGTPLTVGATALVRFTPTEHLGVLEVSNLAPLPATQTYQLWLIDNSGNYQTGGLFQMPALPNQQIAVLVVAPRNFKDYARFGISIEPNTGSPHPTGPLAFGSL